MNSPASRAQQWLLAVLAACAAGALAGGVAFLAIAPQLGLLGLLVLPALPVLGAPCGWLEARRVLRAQGRPMAPSLIVAFTALGGVAAVGGVVVARAANVRIAIWNLAPFDCAAWRRDSPCGDHRCVRGSMSGRLVLGGRLDEMPRADVRALLGEPDCPCEFATCDAWDLGEFSRSDMDPYCLYVEFNDERVRRVRIVQQ